MSIDSLPKAAEHHEETAKAPPIASKRPKVKYKVKYVASPADIPAGQNHVLVEYGAESGQKKHALGFTITVARNQSTSDLAPCTQLPIKRPKRARVLRAVLGTGVGRGRPLFDQDFRRQGFCEACSDRERTATTRGGRVF